MMNQLKAMVAQPGVKLFNTLNAILLPSPVFCKTKPKYNAGMSIQTAGLTKPEATTGYFSPSIRLLATKNAEPAKKGTPPGLKIHKPRVIITEATT